MNDSAPVPDMLPFRTRNPARWLAALSAEPGASSGAGSTELQIVFQINGGASPETVDALHEYGDEFAERVLEVIEEAEYDRRRVSFT